MLGYSVGLSRQGRPGVVLQLLIPIGEKASHGPHLVSGLRVERWEMPRPRPLAVTAAGVDTCARHRPLLGGISVGTEGGRTGTLGAMVRCRRSGGTARMLLSNNHVLADYGAVAVGSVVMQPGPGDWGHSTHDKVGTLARAVPLLLGGVDRPNAVDAAIATVDDSVWARLEASPHTATPETWRSLDAIPLGLPCRKVGRTTGLTRGAVVGVAAFIETVTDGSAPLAFRDQIMVDLRAMGGDSGSLLVAESDGSALGLICVATQEVAFANPIETVQDTLEIDVAGRRWNPDGCAL